MLHQARHLISYQILQDKWLLVRFARSDVFLSDGDTLTINRHTYLAFKRVRT